MFTERRHPTGHITLHSSLLLHAKIPHGFTTRAGGLHVGTPGHLGPLLEAMQLPHRRVVMSRQVHGCAVTEPDSRTEEADAHVTDDPGEFVAVRTADCVPILLASSDGRCVAAVHAGWRGLLPKENTHTAILNRTCDCLLTTFGVSPDQLIAAVGPCIDAEYYEVGPEFQDLTLRAGHLGSLHAAADGRHRLDLRRVAREQLERLGLPANRIDVSPHCTFADADRFYSYRRDGRGCGHMAAFVGPAPKTAG